MEKDGHSVWWDLRVHPGSNFTTEIAHALNNADTVVVLWSRNSIKSTWVLDEAAAGRDSSKLLPVLLDTSTPPLGFRQFQNVDLSNWSGRGKPTDLLKSLAAFKTPDSSKNAAPSAERGSKSTYKRVVIAAAVVLAAAGAGWMFWENRAPSTSVIIATASGDRSQETRAFSRQIESDLTQYQTRDLASLTFLSDGERARYRLELALDKGSSKPSANLSLKESGRPGIAWATAITGNAGHLVDLRQQTTAAVTAVLRCAISANVSRARLGDQDYRNFLDGCVAVSTDFWEANAADLIPTFKHITQSNPKFAPAQALLVLADLSAFETAPPSAWKALGLDGRAALAQAQALDPTSDLVIGAAAMFRPRNPAQWDGAFPIVDNGLKLHPDSVILLRLHSSLLMSIGRTREAVVNARQALEQDPLSPQIRLNLINVLVYSGQLSAGREELAKAEAIWPNSTSIADARFRVDLRYGDPRRALAYVLSRSPDTDVSSNRSWAAFIEARLDPTPAKIDAALNLFRERYRHDRADVPAYLQALGTFGRVDEAMEIMRNPIALDGLEASTDILFRPHMRPIFSDPRFMNLANGLGLLAYWSKTNIWPDFCSDPQLPYDCRKEARKFGR